MSVRVKVWDHPCDEFYRKTYEDLKKMVYSSAISSADHSERVFAVQSHRHTQAHTQRHTKTHRDRDRDRDTHTDTEIHTGTHTHTHTHTKTHTDRDRDRDTDTERDTEIQSQLFVTPSHSLQLHLSHSSNLTQAVSGRAIALLAAMRKNGYR